MAERIDREELRQLIREALKEALGASPPPYRESPPPARGRDTEGGKAQQQPPSPSPPPSPQGGGEKRSGAFRFDSGVLNESKVAEIGRTHAKIVIGAEVAVTPLARDRAREIRIEIVRQKP